MTLHGEGPPPHLDCRTRFSRNVSELFFCDLMAKESMVCRIYMCFYFIFLYSFLIYVALLLPKLVFHLSYVSESRSTAA